MRFIDMSDYNRNARAYWWTTTSIGALAFSYAVFGVLRLDINGQLGVAALMAVVFLAGLRPITVPGTKTSITPGDIFVFLTALFWGPAAATLVAATDALAGSCRTSRRWTSRLGGPALMSLAALTSASLFQLTLSWLRHSDILNTPSLLAALLLFSAAHFALNSLLAAAPPAIQRHTGP